MKQDIKDVKKIHDNVKLSHKNVNVVKNNIILKHKRILQCRSTHTLASRLSYHYDTNILTWDKNDVVTLRSEDMILFFF